MNIGAVTVLISRCTTGVYLRWWFNGWHYYNFTNGYEITMSSEVMDTQVTNMFSVISKIEHPTKLKAEYSYQISLEGIRATNISAFTGLLLAEKVEQYEGGIWREVEITRGGHIIREDNSPGYILNFEITRKELPNTPAVFQKSLLLYIGATLCDMDEDEIVPINKQTNDIAEMQDRQSDFTSQFKIRKTRAMRSLFELSGEVGANTTFPYENQLCKLVQDNIEVITDGYLILDKVDDQYYYVSIYSGNLNFFKVIGNTKIADLDPGVSPDPLDHTWNIATQELTHIASPSPDYIYPLLEPSDDATMLPLRLAGNLMELYGGWIWPFVKVSTLWDEIFTNAGFICKGDILTNPVFQGLYIPIVNLNIPKARTDKFLYSVVWNGSMYITVMTSFGWPGAVLINGDYLFQQGQYYTPFTATYKMRIVVKATAIPVITLLVNFVHTPFIMTSWSSDGHVFELEYYAVAGTFFTFWTDNTPFFYSYYSVSIIDIVDAKISYGSVVSPRFHLPDITQTELIKTICNMFGLIPDVTARDRVIRFWNYSELYNNIAQARDWSAYLSEREDETEFKFGDYAQNNYLRYEKSDDVLPENGRGTMIVDDETLEQQKDVLTLGISTCDEVTVATTAPTINTSRIAMNKWYDDAGTWKPEDSIDPRIVLMKRADGKTLKIWDTVDMNINFVTIVDPYMATSIDIAFSSLLVNYGSLSRMLTKTNLRRVKFNLPVYEVAGLKHYIPIYLSQYRAYFYVNKINNYVPGKLCTVDLIKL